MQKLLIYILVFWGTLMYGATRGDVKILEAVDNISYAANKLAKDYLLYYKYPHKSTLRKNIDEDIKQLDKSVHEIAITTKDPKTKVILKYFAYEKSQIKELLKKNKNDKETLSRVLDFSEGVAEGGSRIAARHKYKFTKEEKMWFLVRHLIVKSEEINKYYIAQGIMTGDREMKVKMLKSLDSFSSGLNIVNSYQYSGSDIGKEKAKLNSLLGRVNKIFSPNSKIFIPNIATLLSERIESVFEKLSLYHNRNL